MLVGDAVRLIRGLKNLRAWRNSMSERGKNPEVQPGVILTVGAFDGLHQGHRAVIRHVKAMAAARGVPSAVLTLEPLPREYFSPVSAPARLMSFREKVEGLSALGIDYVLLIRFNETMRNTGASEFVSEVFVDGLKAQHIVIGDDFRFGKDGGGDYRFLVDAGKLHGFTVEATQTQVIDDERVSSTRIRELLELADFSRAEKLLGRPYSISGKVVYGRQLGRDLGVPTANVELHRLRAAMSGVYAAEVKTAGEKRWLAAVANVGTRPTVNDSIKAILEVHILDFECDLYGQRIEVRFRNKIREEKKFESVARLQQQILRDIELARTWFSKA